MPAKYKNNEFGLKINGAIESTELNIKKETFQPKCNLINLLIFWFGGNENLNVH